MTELNLGCGKDARPNMVNVDVTDYEGVNQVVDLNNFPWPWADGSIDGVHAYHIIEHFPDQDKFIFECLRILKKGGFLRLRLPHSSCVSSVGCWGHYRTYSYDAANDYLTRDFYLYKRAIFKTVEQKLLWWSETIDVQGCLPKPCYWFVKIMNPIINFIIRLHPRIFENCFSNLIQCREVIWKGVKL